MRLQVGWLEQHPIVAEKFMKSDITEKEKIIEDSFSQVIDKADGIITRLTAKQKQIVKEIK